MGVFARDEIAMAAAARSGRQTNSGRCFRPAPSAPLSDTGRLRITPRHLAFLKISEGCNRLCSFCSIPQMRGTHASKPIEEVVAEAEELAADGVRELVMVAQDTTYYGMDMYGEPRLAELLRRLEQVDGLDWIRLMYLYPMYITDELIDVIAAAQEVLPYLDMPLQHINDEVLRRMRRRVEPRRNRAVARPAARSGSPAGAADHAHHRLSRRDRRAVRGAAGVRPAAAVRAAGGVRLLPASRARRPPSLTDHVPEEVKQVRRDD